MALFTIDQKKCRRDGLCQAACPAQIIIQEDKKSFPALPGETAKRLHQLRTVSPSVLMALFAFHTMPLSACPPMDGEYLDAPALKHLLLAGGLSAGTRKRPSPANCLRNWWMWHGTRLPAAKANSRSGGR